MTLSLVDNIVIIAITMFINDAKAVRPRRDGDYPYIEERQQSKLVVIPMRVEAPL